MPRVLSFLIRYFSNYYTLHRSDLAARAAPLDPGLRTGYKTYLRVGSGSFWQPNQGQKLKVGLSLPGLLLYPTLQCSQQQLCKKLIIPKKFKFFCTKKKEINDFNADLWHSILSGGATLKKKSENQIIIISISNKSDAI